MRQFKGNGDALYALVKKENGNGDPFLIEIQTDHPKCLRLQRQMIFSLKLVWW